MTILFQKRFQAFSLIELLVAVAVTSVLLVLLSELLSVTLHQYRRETDEHVKNAEAHAVLDLLEEDLRAAVIKGDGSEWLNVKRIRMEDSTETPWLMFLSRPTDSGGVKSGDVCAVSYRVEYQEPFAKGEKVPCLYRCVLSPEETFQYLGSRDLYTDIWKDRVAEARSPDCFLASNVARLDYVFHVEAEDGSRHTLTANREVRGARFIWTEAEQTNPDTPETSYLKGIRIGITILNATGQKALNAGSVSREDAIAKYGKSYSAEMTYPPFSG